MKGVRPRLHFAIQKSGRLAEGARGLLRSAGFRIQDGKNALAARIENFEMDLLLVRDDDIPTFVGDGACEFGVVGRNVLAETALEAGAAPVDVIFPLGFGQCALRIASPAGTPYDDVRSLTGSRIATSYPNLTRRFLADAGVVAEVVRMSGAVELAPRLQIAPFICDLVSTGTTLEANGLVARDVVLDSEAVLIRTRKPLDPARLDLADRVLSRFQGVLATQESKYIMLNAPEAALDRIADLLPGAEAPTILPLAGRPGHFAVHAVCREAVFWETLQELKDVGASAILVVPIEKMLA